MKHLILGGLLIAAMAQVVQAEESSKTQKNAEPECIHDSDRSVTMEQSLKILESKLSLNEPQKPLWTTWSNQILAAHHSKDEFKRTEKERRKLPAPERQELWMTSVEVHLNAMKDSLPALKALYNSLNDQQKVIFDGDVPFKHHCRMQ